jgi:hypothetical protein
MGELINRYDNFLRHARSGASLQLHGGLVALGARAGRFERYPNFARGVFRMQRGMGALLDAPHGRRL